jgi:hypothetical protein
MEPSSVTKIKVRIGDFEFEAEGPAETVQEQFAAFKEMISAIPKQVNPPDQSGVTDQPTKRDDGTGFPHLEIQKIMHVSGRVVSLTALPPSTEDAALLIMLGHKDMRDNVAVTGQEIGDGLSQSGRPVARVDRLMEKALHDAFVLKTGIKRSTRYRLTNQGLNKALGIARDLMATLP